MFTKIYFTIAIVLHCNKKCSNFLWYFDGKSVVSLISRQKLCVFILVVSFQLVEFANWNWKFSFSGGRKICYGIFFFLLYVRKDQVQEQSGCKFWFHCNKQKSGYLHC